VGDRKLLFTFEAVFKQKTKRIAIILILSAKLNTKEERKRKRRHERIGAL
jgi:hypothetical protein